MKILLERKKFTDILQNANSYIISKKTTITAIQNVLLTIVSEKEVSISSTDIDVYLIEKMEADSQVELIGKSYILDSKFLVGLLTKLDGDTIILEILKSTVKILSEGNNYTIPFEQGKDFIELQNMGKATTEINFSTAVLKNYINKCLPFITSDENNPVFSGIHYKMDGKLVLLEAVNRATGIRATDEHDEDANIDVVIPSKFAETYLKGYDGEDTKLIVGKKNIRLEGENFLLQGRLLDQVFPNIDPIFSQERPHSIVLVKEPTIPALKRILLVNQTVKISKWTMNKKDLTIEAQNNDFAMKGSEKLPFVREGDDIEIGLNPDLVLRALASFPGKEVTLHYMEKMATVLINDENGAIQVMIAPMKV